MAPVLLDDGLIVTYRLTSRTSRPPHFSALALPRRSPCNLPYRYVTSGRLRALSIYRSMYWCAQAHRYRVTALTSVYYQRWYTYV